mmetsp:Transcript_15890/g.26602  ORF Transcript_15890/g.26602 Transcript_15890/m.26602 type:complete len:343 (-) Transcript_15890:97-1125(-)
MDLDIYDLISSASYSTSYTVTEGDEVVHKDLPFTCSEYQLIPINENLNKHSAWIPLGNYLSNLEKDLSDISGSHFFTVRMDGKNFSKLYKDLQQMELFSQGCAQEYDNIMIAVCRGMTNHLPTVTYAYTQSDEITLVCSSTQLNSTSQNYEPHLFAGRHDKIISFTASLATQFFCKELMQLYLRKQVGRVMMEDLNFGKLPVVTFDSRIAKFDSLRNAFQMVLWRSYDCSVNSVSTALRLLHCCKDNEISKGELNGLSTLRKALLLHEESLLLSLSDHQKYGTLLYYGRDAAATAQAGSLHTATEAPNTSSKKSKRRKTSCQIIPGQPIINVKEGVISLGNV